MEQFNHAERIAQLKREIFRRVGYKVLHEGTYIPERNGYAADITELGACAVGLCVAEESRGLRHPNELPDEVYIGWARPDRDRSVELWITQNEIDAQYTSSGSEYIQEELTHRHPIHHEALLELHDALISKSDD